VYRSNASGDIDVKTITVNIDMEDAAKSGGVTYGK
jgi:hypothetical protein